jgi:hypothetical protein
MRNSIHFPIGVVGSEIGRKSHENVMWSNRPDMFALSSGKK